MVDRPRASSISEEHHRGVQKQIQEYKKKIEEAVDKYAASDKPASIKEHAKGVQRGKAVFDGCKEAIKLCQTRSGTRPRQGRAVKNKLKSADEVNLVVDKFRSGHDLPDASRTRCSRSSTG